MEKICYHVRAQPSAASEDQIEGSTSKAKRHAISGTAMKQMGEISFLSPDCNKSKTYGAI